MRTSIAVLLFALSLEVAAAAPGRKLVSQDHECRYHDTGGCGVTVADEVNIFGCTDEGYYYNVHRIFLTAGQSYQATLTALDDFIPEIGVSRAEIDYYLVQGMGTTSRGAVTVSFVAEVTGHHEFYVGPNTPGKSGRYTLALACGISQPTCTPSATEACLSNGRFRVSIAFVNQFANPPQPGSFLAKKLREGAQNPDVAIFGISAPEAIEVVVRIQDARPFGLNRFDIYYGGLTDLEYTVTVTDTQRGVTKTYRNPPGTVGGGVDRTTFTAN
ncbi:MAG TPA: hypothetical protein VEO54_18870 [Thermoanaerobaculia bacterium]|nr:hypothetical protein [Thermoanaerobaculia bacterium]